jgi:hypothetical protein
MPSSPRSSGEGLNISDKKEKAQEIIIAENESSCIQCQTHFLLKPQPCFERMLSEDFR